MKNYRVAAVLSMSILINGGVLSAEWNDDVAAALKKAGESKKPVLVLVRNAQDLGSLDAGHWLRDDASLGELLSGFECAMVWHIDPSLKDRPNAPRAGLYFLTPSGEVIAVESIPIFRREIRGILEETLRYPLPADELQHSALAPFAHESVDAPRCRRAIHVLTALGRADEALFIQHRLDESSPPAPFIPHKIETGWLEVVARQHRASHDKRLAGVFAAFQKADKTEDMPKPATMRASFVGALKVLDDDAPNTIATNAQAAFEKWQAEPKADEALKTARTQAGKLADILSQSAERFKKSGDDAQKEWLAAHPDSFRTHFHNFAKAMGKFDRVEDDEKTVRTLIPAIIAQPLKTDELAEVAGYLMSVIIALDMDKERHDLAERIERELRVGRHAADVYLDQADIYYSKGEIETAQHFWNLAEEATSDGESPTLNRCARNMRALVDPATTPNRSKWAEREVLNAVVLVPDFEAYQNAISQWTDREFFPVLFQDDIYAPKFIAAFRPAQVLLVKSAGHTPAPPSVGALQRIVLSSWTANKADVPAAPTEYELRAALEKLGVEPSGVVFGDGESGEMAGGLALAAGRFQPLEYLARRVVGSEGHIGSEEHYMSYKTTVDMGRQIREDMRFWGLPYKDRWAYVTLAGKYPYRYWGERMPWSGTTYATEDMLGRDEDTIRIAVCGRLMGDYARSSYQAMCSLFLQPESAFLFNTYGSNPKSEWGQFRMDLAEKLLFPRMNVTHIKENATVDAFRAHALPWNKDGLVFINSSGYPDRWSVADGEGTTEDFVIGVPSVVNIVHSGSAAELYETETIAHRAVWGGAYWYFGSSAEPLLDAFQPLRYVAPRIVNGVPLAAAFRLRASQNRFWPWRLLLVGDPQFCLREQPAKRKEMSEQLRVLLAPSGELAPTPIAESPPPDPLADKAADLRAAKAAAQNWAEKLRFARWRNKPDESRAMFGQLPELSLFDGPTAAMAIEEMLKTGNDEGAVALWLSVSDEAKKNYAARTYARYAAGALMDKAREAKDLKALLSHFTELLTTTPARNFAERWNERVTALAKESKADADYIAWLTAASADARLSAFKSFLVSEALIHKESWSVEDKTTALNAFADVVKGQADEDLLRAPFDAFAKNYMAKVPNATAAMFVADTSALFKAETPEAQRLAGHLKNFLVLHRLSKDWLILGPFKDQKIGAWENVGPKTGQTEPDFSATFAGEKPENPLKWTRPFKAGDTGIVDLAAMLKPNQNVYAYAAIEVSAGKEADGVLLIGSDDGVTAWLDGKEIHRNPASRGVTVDEDKVPVKLSAGKHSLVLRIDQGTGGWGFCARIADKDGNELPGVTLRCPKE